MPTMPMDLMGIYLTARMGVGQRLTLTSIDSRVKALPLRRSLMLISQMCFRAERSDVSVPSLEDRLQLASQVFPSQ